MKKAQRIGIVLAAFLGLASAGLNPLFAEDKGPRFDEGVDTSKVLEDLKKHVKDDKTPAPQSRAAALLRISSDALLIPEFALKDQPVSTLGWVFGPWQPLILNDPNRPDALEILPRLEELPVDVRDPLKKQWGDLETVRRGLLSDAAALEKVDAKLFDDGTALDQEADDLQRQGDKLRQEVRDFNDTCVDRPLPPDQYQRCLRWQADLKARIGQYNQKVENHNSRVIAWKRRAYGDQGQTQDKMAGGVQGAGRALTGNISIWAGKIRPWVDAAKKAMEAVCRSVDHLESRPPQDSVFTGGFPAKFEVRAFFKAEPKDAPPCPVDYLWTLEVHPPIPPGPLGTLSPKTGPKTVFTSGNYAGLGTVLVEDRNSGNGTGSTINVVNPSR